MLSNNQKRLILFFIALLFSSLIWYTNASWGNTFFRCLILSTTTLLIIIVPFEIYWSFRDIWFDRWPPINLTDVSISSIEIEIDGGLLVADLILSKDQNLVQSTNTIVIFCHGFSDTKESLQYLYLPLVCNGHVIITYDARGTGKSKKAGERSDFLKRIDDYERIIYWIKAQKKFNQMKLYSVGISIGAITALCGGFTRKEMEKIVAISSISNYKKNMSKLNPLILFSYFIKGVKINPSFEESQKLSPYFIIKMFKKNISRKEWEIFSEKVLLIHAKNDRIIKLKNFKENRLILELKEENQLLLRKGGHMQKKNELAIVGTILRFLNS